jgi:hypothetical protein
VTQSPFSNAVRFPPISQEFRYLPGSREVLRLRIRVETDSMNRRPLAPKNATALLVVQASRLQPRPNELAITQARIGLTLPVHVGDNALV